MCRLGGRESWGGEAERVCRQERVREGKELRERCWGEKGKIIAVRGIKWGRKKDQVSRRGSEGGAVRFSFVVIGE